MTIEKYGVQCDSCRTGYESTGDYGLTAKVARIKKLGWKIYRLGPVWRHKCPQCLENDRVAAQPEERIEQWWQR